MNAQPTSSKFFAYAAVLLGGLLLLSGIAAPLVIWDCRLACPP